MLSIPSRLHSLPLFSSSQLLDQSLYYLHSSTSSSSSSQLSSLDSPLSSSSPSKFAASTPVTSPTQLLSAIQKTLAAYTTALGDSAEDPSGPAGNGAGSGTGHVDGSGTGRSIGNAHDAARAALNLAILLSSMASLTLPVETPPVQFHAPHTLRLLNTKSLDGADKAQKSFTIHASSSIIAPHLTSDSPSTWISRGWEILLSAIYSTAEETSLSASASTHVPAPPSSLRLLRESSPDNFRMRREKAASSERDRQAREERDADFIKFAADWLRSSFPSVLGTDLPTSPSNLSPSPPSSYSLKESASTSKTRVEDLNIHEMDAGALLSLLIPKTTNHSFSVPSSALNLSYNFSTFRVTPTGVVIPERRGTLKRNPLLGPPILFLILEYMSVIIALFDTFQNRKREWWILKSLELSRLVLEKWSLPDPIEAMYITRLGHGLTRSKSADSNWILRNSEGQTVEEEGLARSKSLSDLEPGPGKGRGIVSSATTSAAATTSAVAKTGSSSALDTPVVPQLSLSGSIREKDRGMRLWKGVEELWRRGSTASFTSRDSTSHGHIRGHSRDHSGSGSNLNAPSSSLSSVSGQVGPGVNSPASSSTSLVSTTSPSLVSSSPSALSSMLHYAAAHAANQSSSTSSKKIDRSPTPTTEKVYKMNISPLHSLILNAQIRLLLDVASLDLTNSRLRRAQLTLQKSHTLIQFLDEIITDSNRRTRTLKARLELRDTVKKYYSIESNVFASRGRWGDCIKSIGSLWALTGVHPVDEGILTVRVGIVLSRWERLLTPSTTSTATLTPSTTATTLNTTPHRPCSGNKLIISGLNRLIAAFESVTRAVLDEYISVIVEGFDWLGLEDEKALFMTMVRESLLEHPDVDVESLGIQSTSFDAPDPRR